MGTIAVTGVNGFIGGHIVKYLGNLGYSMKCIARSDFLNQNWSVLDDVETVVHCAWPTDKDLHSIEHLEFAEWTCNFFNECKKRGIRVINIGSSSEYGVKYEPMREDMMCEPINAYGIAKLSVTLYAKLLGFNTLRIFAPFGEKGKNFVSKYENVENYGHPSDRRDYFSIDTVSHAVERLIHANHLYGEIINVCSGFSKRNDFFTVGTGKWYKYKQNQYEPSEWVGDTVKMKKLLNL